MLLLVVQPRGDDLDGFEGLQHAHDAHHGAQDAALAAADDALGWGRLGEDAAVARRSGGGGVGEDALGGGRAVENDELAVGAEGGGGDKGLAQQNTGVRDQVARGGVVGAVEDKVVAVYDALCILGSEVLPVWDIFREWVESGMVLVVFLVLQRMIRYL